MLKILTDYSFVTVLLGTLCLALAASQIGTVTVLTRQSLIGDSLGHAAYPGVLAAYMVFQSRQPFLLMLGAMLAGWMSYRLISWLSQFHRMTVTNLLPLIAAGMFGMGLVLKQILQGSSLFSGSAQAGLQTYLFGQAAFIQKDDVYLIAGVSLVCLFLFLLLYGQLTFYLFDPDGATLAGVNVQRLEGLIRLMMVSLIAVGLKVVGAILISSFLIAPAVCGLIVSVSYRQTLLIAGLSALLSAAIGTYASSMISGASTGSSIILCQTLLIGLAAFVRKIREVRHA